MPPHPLYDRAALYEAAFSWDPAPEAAFYDALLGPGRLLDVGCGTGRILLALRSLGRADLVGLEREPAMVAKARARGLDAREGDMRAFALEPACDGALSHLSTFRYLLEDADVRAHWDAMATALPRAGALYAIDHDLVGPDYDPAHLGQRWSLPLEGGGEVKVLWRALGAPREGRVVEECVIEAGDERVSHREELRAWTLDEFMRAVASHGAFEVARWYAPPFEVAAPFSPVPWTPRDETRRVVAVLRRR